MRNKEKEIVHAIEEDALRNKHEYIQALEMPSTSSLGKELSNPNKYT